MRLAGAKAFELRARPGRPTMAARVACREGKRAGEAPAALAGSHDSGHESRQGFVPAGLMQRECVANRPSQYAEPAHSGAEAAASSDAVLVAQLAAGNTEAFQVLVQRHVGSVAAIARRMLGDDAEAEDVTQEAFLKLWRLGGGLSIDAAGVRPWLRRVVSNLAIDRIRVRRRTDLVDEVPDVPVPAEQLRSLEGTALATRVDQALQALPERQRTALTLFHFEGLSQREVGASMGVSDEAVESLLARARRSLKVVLADDWRELVEHEP